jgi:hypothetical protein
MDELQSEQNSVGFDFFLDSGERGVYYIKGNKYYQKKMRVDSGSPRIVS